MVGLQNDSLDNSPEYSYHDYALYMEIIDINFVNIHACSIHLSPLISYYRSIIFYDSYSVTVSV